MFQEGGLRVQAPRPAHLASIAARLRQAAMIYLLEYFGFFLLSTGTCFSILDPDCIGFNWVIGRVADPMFITDPDFFPHPGSRALKSIGFRIRIRKSGQFIRIQAGQAVP
jgi:hypothetical protein